MHASSSGDGLQPSLPSSPGSYMISQYDTQTGETAPRSSSLPNRQHFLDMREATEVLPSCKNGQHSRQGSGRRLTDAGATESSNTKRRNGPLGTVVRKLFLNKPDRPIGEAMSNQLQPTTPRIPHPVNNSRRQGSTASIDHFPLSPLTAHPPPVAGAGDMAVRINQLLSPNLETRQGQLFPDFKFPAPAIPREVTRHDYHEPSVVSKDVKHVNGRGADNSAAFSTSRSTRRRSRSVSAVSEVSHKHSYSRLRPQRSDRNLSSIKEAKGRRSITSEECDKSRLHSKSSVERLRRIIPDVSSPSLPDTRPVLEQDTPAYNNSRSSAEARRTFDFESLAEAMVGQQERVSLQGMNDRLKTLEIKGMDLEHSFSKLQARLPVHRPVGNEASAQERVQSSPANASTSPKRRKSPPARLYHSSSMTCLQQDGPPARSNPRADLPAHPVPPTPSPATMPPIGSSQGLLIPTLASIVPPTAWREGVASYKTENHEALMAVIQFQQVEQQKLADRVDQLQSEVSNLKQLVGTLMGRSNGAMASDVSRETHKSLQKGSTTAEVALVSPTRVSGETDGPESVTRQRGRGRVVVHEAPPSPAASDTSSDASFGNGDQGYTIYTPTLDSTRFGEATLITSNIPAGQAF